MDWLQQQEAKFTRDLIDLTYRLQEERHSNAKEQLRREIAATIRLRRQVREALTV